MATRVEVPAKSITQDKASEYAEHIKKKMRQAREETEAAKDLAEESKKKLGEEKKKREDVTDSSLSLKSICKFFTGI